MKSESESKGGGRSLSKKGGGVRARGEGGV